MAIHIYKEEFAALMVGLNLPKLPQKLAVAVSGGADSMALALLSDEFCRKHDIPLTALTVDHGIRPEAAAEAVQVKAWLAARGVPCEILTANPPPTPPNLQEKARQLRYRLMTEWCHAHKVPALLVAHHADDQLETVLMRLIRAAGVEGLAAMRPVSHYGETVLLRPLLSVSKARLMATLEAMGQEWIEDPSNQSDRYMRNRIRRLAYALEEEGLSADRVTLLTRQLAETADFIASEVEKWSAAHVRREAGGDVSVASEAWRDVPREIGWRALRRLIQEVGGGEKAVRSQKLMPLYEVLAAGALCKPRTLGGCILKPERNGMIHFLRET